MTKFSDELFTNGSNEWKKYGTSENPEAILKIIHCHPWIHESGIHESIVFFFQWIHPANLRPLGETSLQNPRGSVFAISPSTQLQLGKYENSWVFSYGYITWISSEYMYMSVDVYIYTYIHTRMDISICIYTDGYICKYIYIYIWISTYEATFICWNIFAMNTYMWISLDYDADTTYSKGMKSQSLLFHCLFHCYL